MRTLSVIPDHLPSSVLLANKIMGNLQNMSLPFFKETYDSIVNVKKTMNERQHPFIMYGVQNFVKISVEHCSSIELYRGLQQGEGPPCARKCYAESRVQQSMSEFQQIQSVCLLRRLYGLARQWSWARQGSSVTIEADTFNKLICLGCLLMADHNVYREMRWHIVCHWCWIGLSGLTKLETVILFCPAFRSLDSYRFYGTTLDKRTVKIKPLKKVSNRPKRWTK